MDDLAKRVKSLENRVKALEDHVHESKLTEDELLTEAKKLIKVNDFVSAALLQRRFSIGYSRAARILDILEGQGLVGEAEGAKPRKVIKKK